MPQIQSIESFSFEIGGYFAQTYKINALYNVVHFDSATLYQRELKNSKVYTEEQIATLITSLNKIDVLRWKSNYETDTLDGIQWELKIHYNHSKTKKIYGSNAYPNIKGQSNEPTEIFNDLLLALSNFIEVSDFFENESLNLKNKWKNLE